MTGITKKYAKTVYRNKCLGYNKRSSEIECRTYAHYQVV